MVKYNKDRTKWNETLLFCKIMIYCVRKYGLHFSKPFYVLTNIPSFGGMRTEVRAGHDGDRDH